MVAPASQTSLRTAAEERYLNYALSVITARALPDVRDGLKPVQRRILFAMHENLHLAPQAKPRKAAAVVGEVLGKYHPHGDQAAYEALVRMAQPFSLRYPLVHGEGNFGSIDGDGAAAMRYTEARLTALAEEMLTDIAADTVPFRVNYDATLSEPVVLPARIPQLLVNGAAGIAVGMATNIPPHNLGETIDALVAMIEDPQIDTRGLLKRIRGPDFPTGGEILTSRRELRTIYESGHGAVRIRGQYTVERLPRGKCQVVVHSVPYGVNKAQLVERIGELVAARKLPQATDVRDESTDGVRIVIELKADASPEVVMAYLYKHTDLQVNFHVNLTCLLPTASPLGGQPARIGLREMCRHFLDFRMAVVTRRLEYEKRRLEERLHILDGLARIHQQLDVVLRLIRRAASRAEAAAKLMATFRLDEPQVDAILEIRLYQLARLEVEKVIEERDAKRARLAEVESQLARPRARWKLVREELEGIRQKYADARRTALAAGEDLVYDPDAYVVHEETTVVLSRDGWVKRLRELRDPAATRLREGDTLFAVLRGNTRDRFAVFTTLGGLYVLRVADLPATTGYGEPIHSLLKLQDAERVVAALLVPAAEEGETPQGELFGESGRPGAVVVLANFLVATTRGYGFRFTPDLSETTRSGRRVARIARGDTVVSVTPVDGEEVVCGTSRGKMLRFPVAEVAELAGPGRGVILLRPGADAHLVGALCPPAGEKIVAVLEDGHEREISRDQVPAGRRAGRGLRVVKRGTLVGLRRATTTPS